MFGLNNKEKAELEAKINKLEAELVISKSLLDKNNDIGSHFKAEYNKIVDHKDALNKKIYNLESNNSLYQTQNAALVAENKVLHSVNTNVQKTVEDNVKLKAEVESLNSTIKVLNQVLKASEAREEDARKREAKAVDQVFTLKREVIQTAVVSPTVITPQVLPTSGK